MKNHPWDLARQPRKNKGITVLLGSEPEVLILGFRDVVINKFEFCYSSIKLWSWREGILDAEKEAKQTLEFFFLITFWFVEDVLSFRDIY